MSDSIHAAMPIVVKTWTPTTAHEREDVLAVEEPMELRLGYMWKSKRVSTSISITMRTPGRDFELALGFLLTEGIVKSHDDVESIAFCGEPTPEGMHNVVRVELVEDVVVDIGRLKRHFYTSSSCGVCGKASLEALAFQKQLEPFDETFRIPAQTLAGLPERMRVAQQTFERTGGLHAAGVFDADGQLLAVCEDVGRHNALDKLIGTMAMSHTLPVPGTMILLSGRVSFELMQKAIMAGFQCVAAVGAPSSLALALAQEYNVTLVGFVRPERLNIYHAEARII